MTKRRILSYYIMRRSYAINYKGWIDMAENSCCTNGCICVGYAYVPPQRLEETFSPEEALCMGSLFPELVLTMCEYGKVCKQEGGNA